MASYYNANIIPGEHNWALTLIRNKERRSLMILEGTTDGKPVTYALHLSPESKSTFQSFLRLFVHTGCPQATQLNEDNWSMKECIARSPTILVPASQCQHCIESVKTSTLPFNLFGCCNNYHFPNSAVAGAIPHNSLTFLDALLFWYFELKLTSHENSNRSCFFRTSVSEAKYINGETRFIPANGYGDFIECIKVLPPKEIRKRFPPKNCHFNVNEVIYIPSVHGPAEEFFKSRISAMHVAAAYGLAEVVRLLVRKYGGDLLGKQKAGWWKDWTVEHCWEYSYLMTGVSSRQKSIPLRAIMKAH